MPDTRLPEATAFAARHDWADVPLRLIAGDASNRKYYRLTDGARTALVMDAPPEKGEDVRPFVAIATWLRDAGLSAPEIYASDLDAGFLLIEDFGDAIFARLLETGTDARSLYEPATDVLVAVQNAAPPDLPAYDAKTMSGLAALAVTWYRTGVLGTADTALEAELAMRMEALLRPLEPEMTCLIQRDYHAENLVWLPERDGLARVGLLDFQDAMRGHPCYDLVSILQDARRDVDPALADAMIARFLDGTGREAPETAFAYAALGLQRNLRILGVFARLWMRDGKPGYLPRIPRVWGHIETDLDLLGDAELSRLVRDSLPVPTPDNLDRIAARCP